MKFAQTTQLLLTLIATLAAVEAYDTPYGEGTIWPYRNTSWIVLTFWLPQYVVNDADIYHLDYHLNIYTAYGSGYPVSWNNNDTDVFIPWVTATDLEAEDSGYSRIDVFLEDARPPIHDYSDLKFLVGLEGPKGKQLFPVNIAATVGHPSFASSTLIPPNVTSSSPTTLATITSSS